MDKNEILEKSKQENRGQDLASLETAKASMQMGMTITICILAVIAVVDALAFSRMNSGALLGITGGCSAMFAYKYTKLRKKHELYIALIYMLAAVFFLVMWIISIAK